MVCKKVDIITTNKTIVVDYLELNFKGDIYLNSDYLIDKTYRFNQNCYIECLPIGNKMFNVIANLYVDDRLIGELRFSPRQGFFDSDLINFKYENVLLYGSDFIQYKHYLVNVLGFEYTCISEMHIAVDQIGNNIGKFVTDYYYKTNPKNPISKTFKTHHKGKIQRKSISDSEVIHWGKITANKSIKIYDKPLEMFEQSPEKESYVHHWWKINGLPYENNNVERFEMLFRHLHAKMFDIEKLNDCDYLASILSLHCKNYFDFEKEYSNHNKKYLKDVTPVSFKEFHTIKLDKFKQEKQYTLRSEHITLKTLYFEYLEAEFIANDFYVKNGVIQVPESLKECDSILQSIKRILAKYPSANQYFQLKKPSWDKEFEKVNDLINKRITIKDFVTAVNLTSSILFSIPDNSDPKYNLPYYKNLSPEQLKFEEMFEYSALVFEKKLDSIKLKKMGNDSNNLKKISKVSIAKNDYNFHQNKVIRDLNNADPMEPIIEEELINDELLNDVSFDPKKPVND